MPDQDPYAATAIKPPAKKARAVMPAGDPYAATAVQASASPPVNTVPSNNPPTQEGFLASAAAPFVDTVKALVPHSWKELGRRAAPGVAQYDAIKNMFIKPAIEQGKQAIDEFKQANAQTPWTSFRPSPAAATHRELSLGHALAALLPGVGPWAAQIAQKEGEQIGTENYSGAAGTAVGNILLALTPKVVGKVGTAIPEALARTLTDTGKGPIRELVAERVAENEKIGAVNTDRLEKQRQDQVKADYNHRAELLKLKQEYAQQARDATEKARTGTAEDRQKVQAKNLAAKQKYEQSVRDTQQKYEDKKAEVTRSNIKAGTDYRGNLLKLRQEYEQQVRDANQKFSGNKAAVERANTESRRQYNQRVGDVVQQNRAATAAERIRVDQESKLQVGGSQLMYSLRQLDQALRARAGTMFDTVREKVGTITRPGTDLGTAAHTALSKISGSSEVPKPFKDILAKYKEAEPNELPFTTSTGGTTIVPKGHPIYEVLKSHGTMAPPVTFGDLQGYYTETGAELSKGTLPGDVYLATKELHNAVGDMMQEMASAAGAGKELWDSRVFYRNYMDAFHEPTGPSGSGSPIAQALLAKDPAVAVDKFAGDAGDRGIAILHRYSDSLANLAQSVRKIAQEKVTIPMRKSAVDIPAPKIKPVPTGANLPLPPVIPDAPIPASMPAGANLPLPGIVETPPAARAANLPLPPVLPEPKTVPVELKPRTTISTPDLVAARRAAAEARAGKVQTRGTWVATWPIFQAMRALWGGHIPSIPAMAIESAGTFATAKAATALMRYPPMMEFLTKARPEDLALIPPDLRGDLSGLVQQARQRGIKVAPALVAAAAAGQQSQTTPAQAIQAMQPVSTGASQ